jgi:hypothetical protein
MFRRCTCWILNAWHLKRAPSPANDRQLPRKRPRCRNNLGPRVALLPQPQQHGAAELRKSVAKKSLRSSIVFWQTVRRKRPCHHPRVTNPRHHARARLTRVRRRQLHRTDARLRNLSARTTCAARFRKARRSTLARARLLRPRRATSVTRGKCLLRFENVSSQLPVVSCNGRLLTTND